MKTIDRDDLTIEEIEREILSRQRLLEQTMGNLYPSIVRKELQILYRKRSNYYFQKPKRD